MAQLRGSHDIHAARASVDASGRSAGRPPTGDTELSSADSTLFRANARDRVRAHLSKTKTNAFKIKNIYREGVAVRGVT